MAVNEGKKIVIATVNINGLPPFYHPSGVQEELIAYPLRHKEICKWFEASNVDIINFQEVFTYRDLRLLKNNLPSYKHVLFVPFVFGPRGALVTFSKVALDKVSYASYFSSAMQVNRSDLPRPSLLRSALKGILVLRARSLPLTIINTHLLYNADTDWSASSRFNDIQKAQLSTLANVTKEQYKSNPQNNVIVVGDLNVETGTGLLKDFTDEGNLYDFFQGDDEPSFHNEYLPPEYKFQHRIDYLLTNNQSLLMHSKRKRIFTQRFQMDDSRSFHLSDHQGLVVTVSL